MEKTDPILTIYHNNSCSKSCAALDSLTQSGIQFQVINYLEEIPSIETLTNLVKKLQCNPHDLIRTKEPIYLQNFEGKILTDEEWIIVMHENPILIQRPIIVNGNKATVARSAEAVNDAF